ncbi:hypothetical protein BWD42_07015 [Sphingobacterium sp. CZ-UAM]|uniref:hypothetical protein n=1 Tax=Sphingobacterium sp. CZ-UAM TaxID=1933868 RepID=UPI0009868661|nr:hypothetical protein [Sphingobacterium sp. CZ-UAM]OOG19656.1 hypothetical protein BWD42_07015 [Sphingobacterium sp. CZ-UAM]
MAERHGGQILGFWAFAGSQLLTSMCGCPKVHGGWMPQEGSRHLRAAPRQKPSILLADNGPI